MGFIRPSIKAIQRCLRAQAALAAKDQPVDGHTKASLSRLSAQQVSVLISKYEAGLRRMGMEYNGYQYVASHTLC